LPPYGTPICGSYSAVFPSIFNAANDNEQGANRAIRRTIRAALRLYLSFRAWPFLPNHLR
jgi:hypothetical protein